MRLEDHYWTKVRRRSGSVAVRDERGRRLTHAQLWASSDAVAKMLAAEGVGAGDVVLVFLPNWTDWMVLFLATIRLHAIPATAPSTMDEASLRHAADLVHARVVAAEMQYRRPTAQIAREAVGAAEHASSALLSTPNGEWIWDVRSGGDHVRDPLLHGVDHLMFTSSTTGHPKATMSSDGGLASGNLVLAERYGLSSETPIFMPSPLGHSIGTCHGARLSLYLGAPLVLQDTWDPDLALRLLEEERSDFTAAATPFLKDLVEATARSPAPEALRVWLCGGAPVPPELIEQAMDALPSTFVTNLWGMTEGGMACCPLDAPKEKVVATSGTALGCQLWVADPEGTPLPAGEEGELIVGASDVILGYLGEPELFDEILEPDGSLRSGDLARLDEEGYLTVTGRIKDLIVRGGVNIAPTAIEAALSTHPGVRKVSVIGLPDERLGERICAVVVPRDGAAPDLPSLVTWAQQQGLPKRSWPEAVCAVEELPMTPAGKVKKQELKEVLWGPSRGGV